MTEAVHHPCSFCEKESKEFLTYGCRCMKHTRYPICSSCSEMLVVMVQLHLGYNANAWWILDYEHFPELSEQDARDAIAEIERMLNGGADDGEPIPD